MKTEQPTQLQLLKEQVEAAEELIRYWSGWIDCGDDRIARKRLALEAAQAEYDDAVRNKERAPLKVAESRITLERAERKLTEFRHGASIRRLLDLARKINDAQD